MATPAANPNATRVIPGSVRTATDNRRATTRRDARQTRPNQRRAYQGAYSVQNAPQSNQPEMPYGVTAEESRAYAEDRAESQRRQRRQLGEQRQASRSFKNAEIGSDAWRAEIARLNAHQGAAFQASPIVSGSQRRLSYTAVTWASTAIIGGWYVFQLSLWGLSSSLIAASFLGGGVASSVAHFSDTLAGAAETIFSIPAYIGFSIAIFSGVISIGTLCISALLFKLADGFGHHTVTNKRYGILLRCLFTVAIIGYLTPILGQWVPWGLFWVYWKRLSRVIPS